MEKFIDTIFKDDSDVYRFREQEKADSLKSSEGAVQTIKDFQNEKKWVKTR